MTRRRTLPAVAALVVALGCGGKAYVRQGFLEHPPRRVAVLPFVVTYNYDLPTEADMPSSHQLGRETFRKTLAQGFAALGYEDVPIDDVDQRLAGAWGPVDEGRWQQASPQELGRTLGVDAVIYGNIERLLYLPNPIYTETSLIASLRMIDAATGEVLWRKKVQAAERGGAAMQKGQVVDFLQEQMRSAYHPDIMFGRVADAATQQALKDFPNPAMSFSPAAPPARARAAKASGALRVAVLPFEIKHAKWRKGAQLLRMNLTADLQESPFDIAELAQVDAALRAQAWSEGQPLPASLSLAKLAQDVRADLILRGTVTRWGRTYLLVHSAVSAGLALELVEPSSGAVVWSAQKHNSRMAGILKGPTGFTSLATSPIKGLKQRYLDRVAHELTQRLVEELSASPTVGAYLSAHQRSGGASGS